METSEQHSGGGDSFYVTLTFCSGTDWQSHEFSSKMNKEID